EALVRWNNPNRGQVFPDQFIPLAEQNGLIRQLDTAVLKKVCQQIKHWQDKGFDFGHVAINISALNFQQMEFCQSIKQITSELNIAPHCIELEITESAMMSDPDQTHQNLVELRNLGFTIALDDFGTGHSSLGHLKNFPIDRIKIDKSFIKDIETSEQDKNIVSVIIQLAKFLGIQVVSEGVENEHQAYILHVLGCNNIQGFMISKALPASEIENFVTNKIASLPDIAANTK
ncbi:MAG: EAL domain-containing protein, partial [Gammaproteobacteria bacterium]|nr:EAL domain-containing protein [Gammaproteobacteria bacterium]